MGVEDEGGAAAEGVPAPGVGFEGVDHGAQDAVGHGGFEADGAGCGEYGPHAIELGIGHGLGPGLDRVAHRLVCPAWGGIWVGGGSHGVCARGLMLNLLRMQPKLGIFGGGGEGALWSAAG